MLNVTSYLKKRLKPVNKKLRLKNFAQKPKLSWMRRLPCLMKLLVLSSN